MDKTRNVAITNDLLPSIHPSYARIMCAYIQNKGYDIDKLFIGSTLNWQNLLDQQGFISLAQFRTLVLNALQLTQKPWLGVEMAKQLQVSVHGALGYGAVAAPTVKDAFKLIEQAMTTRISLLGFEYIETNVGARFHVDEFVPLAALSQVVYPMLIGAFCDIIEKTTGSHAQQVKVFLPYPQPAWFEQYQIQFPQLTFTFDNESFYIDIPASLLSMHSLTADNFAYRNAQRECLQLLKSKERGGALSEQIKRRLFSMSPMTPQQTQISQDLGISVRTLIRKLKMENTSFQKIIDEVRTELACWELQNTEQPIDDIADRVGFVDTSNFSRVFKRWMGTTPSQFRRQSK